MPKRELSRFVRAASSKATKVAQNGSDAWTLASGLMFGSALVAGGVAFASDDKLNPASYPWDHTGAFDAFDAAAIRRGHQVYKNVCASCHSLDKIAFRNLIGVAYTEDEVKAMAAEVDVKDGPNDEGEYFERPGKPSDYMPSPYPNEENARFANGGAYPPDLSLMVKARPDGANYMFSLLTGYRDPPEGVVIREGLHYNPYFPGGAIAMARQLNDGQVEYDDGTPASTSQMAKDVTVFLNWAAEPEQDERKLMGLKFMFAFAAAAVITTFYKRFRWSTYKTQQMSFKNPLKNPLSTAAKGTPHH
eukprot:GILJ01000427.1.p1 GENE.GILJ01000427.1~~GILJ01000427.1.p1  ORF type:complete len:332 (+),score=43.85 GILJ01000427.1:85-996(+)